MHAVSSMHELARISSDQEHWEGLGALGGPPHLQQLPDLLVRPLDRVPGVLCACDRNSSAAVGGGGRRWKAVGGGGRW